ncbi:MULTISPECIES: protein kinase domain-containing protein [Streptomyces]|uniref:protein kinase domain-containing protein n=1 Tax=Streptomyces TaxID=1883 RepID=UPI00342F5B22
MAEADTSRPGTDELSAADLQRLGAEPLRGSDPREIGSYRVLARLGGGGMGRLYLGRDASLEGAYEAGSLVAVKVIRPEYSEDERFRRRFEREVEAVRRVHGTYTAGLLGSGFDDEERLWMATVYVPGLSLADAVGRFGPLPAPVVWRLAHEIGQALTAITAAGIVHRDLKPSNVLLGADGARVIDFGVAHTAEASALTMTGQHVGTPAYMSPEQADGGEVGTASDVFSLGSVLALAVTGRAPFGEGSTGDVIHRVIYSPPSAQVLDEAAEHDSSLAELIGRCLDKNPEQRPGPQEVVDAAQEHTFAVGWPEPVADVIDARGGWSGRAPAVSPMDQLTVLRRPAPERTERPANSKRRWPLALGAGAAVVAVGAVAIIFNGAGSASPHGGRPVNSIVKHSSSAAVSPPTHGAPTKAEPPKQRPPAARPTVIITSRPGNPADNRGGGRTVPTTAPEQRTRTVTAAPRPPTKAPAAQPWKACNAYSGTTLTQYGDHGSRVVEVQCILKARGYDIGSSGVDGNFGPDTLASVKKFQQRHGLRVDGQVGVHTWAALRA